jgi:outer membrane protein OmpA-like peptidoglycan-associated protein
MKKNTEWMSISDVMSGLMMVFLFITVALLITKDDEINQRQREIQALQDAQGILDSSNNIKKDLAILALKYSRLKLQTRDKRKIVKKLSDENELLKIQVNRLERRAPIFDNTQHNKILEDINTLLHNEFDEDLKRWGAKINTDNSIVFDHPKIYFDSDSSKISSEFKKILSDFFPRYVEIFAESNFGDYIKNIKIEGHTSSVWNWNAMTKPQEQYFNHMELSQDRANSVLKYVYRDIPRYDDFLKSKMESSGLSFSQAVIKESNIKDIDASHRVTFRLIYKD